MLDSFHWYFSEIKNSTTLELEHIENIETRKTLIITSLSRWMNIRKVSLLFSRILIAYKLISMCATKDMNRLRLKVCRFFANGQGYNMCGIKAHLYFTLRWVEHRITFIYYAESEYIYICLYCVVLWDFYPKPMLSSLEIFGFQLSTEKVLCSFLSNELGWLLYLMEFYMVTFGSRSLILSLSLSVSLSPNFNKEQ